MQVDICCFDKTGTLTSDNMVLEGLTGLPGRGQELVSDVKQAGQDTVRVLAACQALIHVDGKFVGDPLEKASFTATGAHCSTCFWPQQILLLPSLQQALVASFTATGAYCSVANVRFCMPQDSTLSLMQSLTS